MRIGVLRALCLCVLTSWSGSAWSEATQAHTESHRASAAVRAEDDSGPDAHPTLTRDAEAALPEDTLRSLRDAAASPLQPPVLLPERPELLRDAQVTMGPRWHAVTMSSRDYSVYVHASAAPIDVPGVARPPVRVPTLRVPRISRTHDIVTAHFVAWGAAWDVDIECLGGVEHPLCKEDVLIHALLRSLKRLGGPP